MLHQVLSLSVLFLSFYHIYEFSKSLSCFVILFTFFLHVFIFSIYSDYFETLKRELKKQRENIFLQSMKKVILVNNAMSSQCEICFDTIEEMEEVCKLNCQCIDKYYHEECIFNWFQKKNSCPFCREKFQFQSTV